MYVYFQFGILPVQDFYPLPLGVTCPPRHVGLILTKVKKCRPLHLRRVGFAGTSVELCTISDAVCSSSHRRLNKLPSHPKGAGSLTGVFRLSAALSLALH
mgnify:CR=1 FL=1